MKTCILVLGNQKDGKSTIIRALTGYRKTKNTKLWDIESVSDKPKPIKAFIVIMSPQEMTNHPPESFPDSLEDEYKIKREDYDVMICPIQTRKQKTDFNHEKYIEYAMKKDKGFDVKIVLIERNHNKKQHKQVDEIRDFCKKQGISDANFITVDTSKDPHSEASRIRDSFYPKG